MRTISPEKKRDIFDRLAENHTDIFDRVELPVEEKVAYSDVIKETIQEEIKKTIASLPLGKIISSIIEKQVSERLKENERISSEAINQLERRMKDDGSWMKSDLKTEIENLRKELIKKYSEVRNSILANKEVYSFGGFPQFGSSEEGKFLKISSGTPAWATGGGGSSLSGFTVNNPDTLQTFDVQSVSLDELAKIVGTMISQLQP